MVGLVGRWGRRSRSKNGGALRALDAGSSLRSEWKLEKQEQKQIPCGNDSQKSKGKSKNKQQQKPIQGSFPFATL